MKCSSKIWTVARKEFSTRLRNRWIWTVCTLLVVCVVAIAVFVCVMVLSKRLKAAAQQSEVPSCAAGVLRRCALLLTARLENSDCTNEIPRFGQRRHRQRT